MRKILRFVGIGLAGLLLLVAAVALFARFQDGPTAAFPGGPLVAGEWAEPSWQDASGLAAVEEIELQLLEPARSRITWVVVHEGVAYVPCGMPNFRLWKQWPHEAMRDGRAVVRTDGKRHRRELVRVTDEALLPSLRDELSRKYPTPPGYTDDPGAVWFFRLDPRPVS